MPGGGGMGGDRTSKRSPSTTPTGRAAAERPPDLLFQTLVAQAVRQPGQRVTRPGWIDHRVPLPSWPTRRTGG